MPVGVGFVRPCSIIFGADQLEEEQRDLKFVMVEKLALVSLLSSKKFESRMDQPQIHVAG
ncbi:hypothetical protein H5410_025892 [Solanum commersonii]|uniref:Uncharacterized protein n=1 Tax=Solanum commersonii TaxID=4109 RepID=A0A9J5YX59_SOLCO|nr:hypothetical protein H5410_025892 [Solanum commersonii]